MIKILLLLSMSKNSIYFSGLAGFRAICAIAVVVAHISTSLTKWGLKPILLEGRPLGQMLARQGVTVFFVLSGFLITYLLQEEKEKTGTIMIKEFYIRRILRIWPLYYLYFIIAILTILFFALPITTEQIMYYLFFVANIAGIYNISISLVVHYWSLSLEEQFYLFWPAINKRAKNLLRVSLISIALIIFFKLIVHHYNLTFIELIIVTMRFHCMLIGAVAALLVKKNNEMFLSFADNKITQAI
jgi:peptidoglycan/LPS O-acetylase OafA/YrhL